MTVLPSPTDQVRYEAGVRTKYAIIAFVAGICVVASLLLQEIGPQAGTGDETTALLINNQRFPLDIIGVFLDGVGIVLAVILMNWIFRITIARDPGRNNPFPRFLILIGGPLIAVAELVSIVLISIKAHTFATTGNQGWPEAYNLLRPISLFLSIINLLSGESGLGLGTLLLGIGFVFVALNAMRVGLLPRPMGYAGMVAGAVFVFALGPISFVIQGVWLVLAAVLIAGRWPSGTPPAWTEVIAIPCLPGGVPDRNARTPNAGTPNTRQQPAAQAAGDYTPRRKKKKR